MVTTVPDDETADRIAAEVGAVRWMREPPGVDYYVEGDEFVPMPACPSWAHVFDWDAKAWTDPRTLDDLRREAWARIKLARVAALGTVMGFDASTESADAMAKMLATLPYHPAEWTVTWTKADNTAEEMGKERFAEVALAVIGQADRVHQVSQRLRQELKDARTADAIKAVVWPS